MKKRVPHPATVQARSFGYSHWVVWKAVVALNLKDWLRARGGWHG